MGRKMDNTKNLYINDEYFGRDCYVGTWEQWRTGMEGAFRSWYKDYTLQDEFFDPYNEIPVSYDEWVQNEMNEHLSLATKEDIKFYKAKGRMLM